MSLSPLSLPEPGQLGFRVRQALTTFAVELRRSLFAKRVIFPALLALLGPALLALGSFFMMTFREVPPIAHDARRLAETMSFLVRFAVFFGCVGIFSGIVRREIEDKSLHYYFLTAVRREVVVAGRFLADLAVAIGVFASAALASILVFVVVHWSEAGAFVFGGPGLAHFARFVVIVALACVAYGGLFALLGTIIRSPILPAVLIFAIESIATWLPTSVQKLTVSFYLQSLQPMSVDAEGFLGQPHEPVSAGLAVLVLLGIGVLGVAGTAFKTSRMELSYGSE